MRIKPIKNADKFAIFGTQTEDVLLYSLFIFLIFFLLFRFFKRTQLEDVNPWILPVAFFVKVLAGCLFLYIYTAHYGDGRLSEDAGHFFYESKIIHDVWYQSPSDYLKILTGIGYDASLDTKYLMATEHWNAGNLTVINDTKNVMRIHSVLHFISFQNVYIHLLFFCAVGLLGFIQLHKAFWRFSKLNPTVFFILLFLVPSALFWSSSTLKEPLSYLGIGLLMRGFFDIIHWKKRTFLIVSGFIFMLLFKSYLLVMMAAPILFFLIFKYIAKQSVWRSILIFAGVISVATIALWPKVERAVFILSRKQYDFTNVGKGGVHAIADTCVYYFEPFQEKNLQFEGDSVKLLKPIDCKIIYFGTLTAPVDIHLEPNGENWFVAYHEEASESYIPLTLIEGSPLQMIKNIPEALGNSVFRPYLKDKGGILKWPMIIELWSVFIFLGLCIYFRRKIDQRTLGIILAMLIFVGSLYLLIGWMTPVVGAIVRYRVPAQLALVIIGLMIINFPKFSKK